MMLQFDVLFEQKLVKLLDYEMTSIFLKTLYIKTSLHLMEFKWLTNGNEHHIFQNIQIFIRFLTRNKRMI